MQGIIKKYIIKRGFGFIEDENKDSRFFHITDVTNPTKIEINAIVDFSPKKNHKGLIATSISVKEEKININVNLSNDKKKLIEDIKKRLKDIKNYTPKVAIFGETGVGKSSLCNALFGREVAEISDKEVCTKKPQEILIGDEKNGGIILIDLPGLGADLYTHNKYIKLYDSLLPKVDLVLLTIRANDRQYANWIEEVYEKILKPKKDEIPILFVITQIDKIEPYREWNLELNKPSKNQENNIIKKSNDISARFSISNKNIIAVSSSNSYHLVKLIDKIIELLPNKEKHSSLHDKKLIEDIKKRVKEIRNYTPKVAVFGDTGVGKSSLCNALFGKEIAKISDVEACTRKPQEILIGDNEKGGIKLIDVPGVGEDPHRHQEYINLYESLLPEMDLVLWAIKADDRKYSTSIEVYEKILKANLKKCPVVFVITQIDKIEPIEEWYENGKDLGETQLQNLLIKSNDISSKFNISTNKVIAISTKNNYNIIKLVEKIVEVLPNEKKYSFVREAKEENVSNEAKIEAEKGILDSIKDYAEEKWEDVKEIVKDVKEIVEIVKDIWGKWRSWW